MSTNEKTEPGSQPLKNAKWEKFIQNLLKGMKHGPAWTAAGYSAKGSAASTNAWRTLKKADVWDRFTYLKARAADGAVMSRKEMLERLTATARGSLIDYLVENGNGTFSFKIDPATPGADNGHQILKKVKSAYEPGGDLVREFEVHNPQAAMEMIAKLEGYFPDRRLEVTGEAGQPLLLEFVEATEDDVRRLKGDSVED